MNNCRSIFNQIIRIEFFNVTDNSLSFSKPFVVYDPTITVSDDANDNAICTVNNEPAFVAVIDDMSASLTVDSATGLPGSKFKNVVEYEVLWGDGATDIEEYKKQLVSILHNNYHMRITYLFGSQHIVRSDAEAWSFSFKESSGKMKITISVENVSGAQRVVSNS